MPKLQIQMPFKNNIQELKVQLSDVLSSKIWTKCPNFKIRLFGDRACFVTQSKSKKNFFQSHFQTTIWILDHLTTGHKSTIQIPDWSGIQMATVPKMVKTSFEGHYSNQTIDWNSPSTVVVQLHQKKNWRGEMNTYHLNTGNLSYVHSL